ncbi:MAG: hypothetical protein JSV83_11860 [Desulfobacterales bacterium]|nr:MAG: hypothetical protein JSV83_11860 [Desulfobacterales bacterium]
MSTLWWVKQIALISIGGFYLYFGVHLLIASYQMNNPFSFILTFFASNFIILISGALLVGFIYRIIAVFRYFKNIT